MVLIKRREVSNLPGAGAASRSRVRSFRCYRRSFGKLLHGARSNFSQNAIKLSRFRRPKKCCADYLEKLAGSYRLPAASAACDHLRFYFRGDGVGRPSGGSFRPRCRSSARAKSSAARGAKRAFRSSHIVRSRCAIARLACLLSFGTGSIRSERKRPVPVPATAKFGPVPGRPLFP